MRRPRGSSERPEPSGGENKRGRLEGYGLFGGAKTFERERADLVGHVVLWCRARGLT
jgi:hypothetical protein